MVTIELADGGLLLYAEGFLPPELADEAFATLLDTVAWEQKPALFGHPQPRLTAAFGDEGVTYAYSHTINPATPWTPLLRALKERLETVRGRYNYCLLNRYRSGADSMGLHADDEAGLGDEIASVSLGAARTFRLRHNTSAETRTFALGAGSLLIMAGTTQRFWKHEIPKTRRTVGERINLTFRWVEG
jgi:alkylated DNA repair dioxygenase AlkB